MSLWVVGCGLTTMEQLAPRDGDANDGEAELLYERVWETTEANEIIVVSESGEWTPELAARVARPWLHVAEGLEYQEEASAEIGDDGSGMHTYRVSVTEVDAPEPVIEPPAHTGVTAVLAETLAAVPEDDLVRVLIKVDVPPNEPLPWLPDSTTSDPAEYAAARVVRHEVAAAQSASFDEQIEPLVGEIQERGGSVEARLWSVGWVEAALPANEVVQLARHDGVISITSVAQGGDGGDYAPLGEIRVASGADAYILNGYDGHFGLSKMKIGVMETSGFEDDGCYLGNNGCTPSQRLMARFTCTNTTCTHVADIIDEQDHGTIVASIAMGDYNDAQAAGLEGFIASGLPSGWQDDASSNGGELSGYYYVAADDVRRVHGYDCARDAGGTAAQCVKVESLNISHGTLMGTECSATSYAAVEGAMELAFDDGVLIAAITHNDNGYPAGDSCIVRSPADMPKALAIGAIEPDLDLPYDEWPYAGYSNRGGGSIKIGNISQLSALSMVDLVAPGQPGYVTKTGGIFGVVSPNTTGFGTSFAAPQVASAALLLKERLLALNHTWVSSPSRLHTAMLSMGDRATMGVSGATNAACVVTLLGGPTKIQCGADLYYGLGRLQLRQHDAIYSYTDTFTNATQEQKRILGPVANGMQIAKCVMQQYEDMVAPNKDNISQIGLTMTVRATTGGVCTIDSGTVYETRTDFEPDDKHMVAVIDADVNIEGRCIQLHWDPTQISTAGTITVATYCDVDDELDY